MLKRVASLLVILTMALGLTTHLSASQVVNLSLTDELSALKDETVYVSLNYDGSAQKTQVVSHIETPKAGRYSDSGTYSEIKSLSSNIQPDVHGNKISWDLPASDSGFYYQGTLTKGDVPYVFTFSFTLDGKPIDAPELVGRSGKVELTIKASPSRSVSDYFTDRFVCQIQVPLSLDKVSGIVAPGAQSMTVGRTRTLAYMVLPGQSKEFKLVFDAKQFEMDAVSATLVPFSIEEFLDLDPQKITSGVDQITSGTSDLIAGTEQLRDGTGVLAAGMSVAVKGSRGVADGAGQLQAGLVRYSLGIGDVISGVKQLETALTALSDQGSHLTEGFDQLGGGMSGILDTLAPLVAALPAEQSAQYAAQMQYLKEHLKTYGTGLKTYTQYVTQSSQGMNALSAGLQTIAQNTSTLVSGAAELHDGAVQVHDGLNELSKGAELFPSELQRLVDGQRKLRSGIVGATDMLARFPTGQTKHAEPVSFADQDSRVRSVQFVIRTPELKAYTPSRAIATGEKPLTFWERLIRLFR
ncbi:MAG: hypothetical protein ACM3ZQ_07120 [Bacillota bacterium]